jgi:hypothetical protein
MNKHIFKTSFSYFIAFSYILHSAADLKKSEKLVFFSVGIVFKKIKTRKTEKKRDLIAKKIRKKIRKNDLFSAKTRKNEI